MHQSTRTIFALLQLVSTAATLTSRHQQQTRSRIDNHGWILLRTVMTIPVLSVLPQTFTCVTCSRLRSNGFFFPPRSARAHANRSILPISPEALQHKGRCGLTTQRGRETDGEADRARGRQRNRVPAVLPCTENQVVENKQMGTVVEAALEPEHVQAASYTHRHIDSERAMTAHLNMLADLSTPRSV